MTQYFVIVSGENTDLAKAETQALVRMVDPQAEVIWINRVGFVETSHNPIQLIIKRAAYVREAGEVLAEISLQTENLSRLNNIIDGKQSFFVRGYIADSPRASGQELAAQIGHAIKSATSAQVSISDTSVKILAIDIGDKIAVCRSYESKTRPVLKRLKGRTREFFHPSLMNAPLARAMCNLAQVKPGQILLDPFCGGGGILCEGVSIGAMGVGIDMNWSLLQGARRNLVQTGNREWTLIQGDSRSIPVDYADHIVTDPPYGRVSSTRGEYAIRLVEALLDRAEVILSNGGNLCICSDSKMNIGDLITERGFTVGVYTNVRVHRCLIREIRVIRF